MEILLQIIALLDRQSLLAACLVCEAFWEGAAPELYRDPGRLSQTRFQDLIRAGRRVTDTRVYTGFGFGSLREIWIEGDLSPRARRAFGFIESLHVHGPMIGLDIEMVWNAAKQVPNTPLFPRVRTFCLDEPESCHFYYRTRIMKPPAGEGILLFDSVDVCLFGPHATQQLNSFTANEWRSLTTHGAAVEDVLGHYPPAEENKIPEWRDRYLVDKWPRESLRLFVDNAQTYVYAGADRFLANWDRQARYVARFLSREVPPVHVYVRVTKKNKDSMLQKLESGMLDEPDPKATLHIDVPLGDETSLPCEICGESSPTQESSLTRPREEIFPLQAGAQSARCKQLLAIMDCCTPASFELGASNAARTWAPFLSVPSLNHITAPSAALVTTCGRRVSSGPRV